MIIIKGDNEQDIVMRIEKELKGEEVDIFQSEDVEYTMEQIAAMIADNTKRSRVAVGRIERNTRKMEETLRETNNMLLPLYMYIGSLLEESYPETMLPPQIKRLLDIRDKIENDREERLERADERRSETGPRAALEKQKEISRQLHMSGRAPKD